MGPDQNMGPGGLATPGTGGCLRALPQQSDALLAFRADGGVVRSTEQIRHGVGEGRAILRLHYPTVRPDRQQRIVLLGGARRHLPVPGVANPPGPIFWSGPLDE